VSPTRSSATSVQHVGLQHVGAEDAHLFHIAPARNGVGTQLVTLAEGAIDHPDERHHAPVLVVDGVKDQRPRGAVGLAGGRRDAPHDRFQHFHYTLACLGRDVQDLVGRAADQVHDLLGPAFGFRSGKIDLVENGDDLQVVLESQVGIGQRLGLDALAGVDHQERPLARGKTTRHLVGKIHMTGGVDEVELIVTPIPGLVIHAHGLSFDGDAPLALDVHAVEHLLAHLAVGHGVGYLQDAVGQRRLSVVDVSDDGKVADVGKRGHGPRIVPQGPPGARDERVRRNRPRRHRPRREESGACDARRRSPPAVRSF
jgi:hypothetical protein